MAANVEFLKNEFCRRKARNPRYSMRAFAAMLEIPSGRLSEIFSGKRPMTPRLLSKISKKLALPPAMTAEDLASQDPWYQLESDQFEMISVWYHFAILSLLETADFRNDPKWIAARLRISAVEVEAALSRLQRLRLIEQKGARLVLSRHRITTSHDVPSGALRSSHRQSLEQAIESLETVAVELRDITSMTMAIDVSKLPEAKAMLRKFRRRLARLLESGNRTQVYNLNIQLIPVTRT